MAQGDDVPIIREFVAARFGRSVRGELTSDEPLFSSGLIDSFGVLELIAFLEDTFLITIDPAVHDLAEFDSIGRIAALVARARAARA